MKNIAVVLAGCGVYDGAEIHEAVLSMYAIIKHGAKYQLFAPDIKQHHVVNHLTGEVTAEERNVLVESARIARGKIQPLSEYQAADFDALLFPGGFGVAKNLCDYAFAGENMVVIPEVAKVIVETNAIGKPIGALCISPVLIAKVLGGVKLTLGIDAEDASNIIKMGALHETTNHGQVIYDSTHKIVTSPCYMLESTIDQIAIGAEKVVSKLIEIS